MSKTRKKSGYIATETGGFGVDPSTSGAGYTPFPALGLPEIPIGVELLDTQYFTGGPWRTQQQVGRGGGSFDVEIPLIGLAALAGNGISSGATADDWLDEFLEPFFPAATEEEGETVNSSTTSSLTLGGAAGTWANQSLVAVASSAAYGVRAQWALITDDSGAPTYDVAPDFVTSPAASVGYGARSYWASRLSVLGGDSRSIVIVDGGADETDAELVGIYRFAGCRPAGFKISAQAGKEFRCAVTWMYDSVTEESGDKTALPASLTAPTPTALTCMRSPIWFDGVRIPTKSIAIDFGLDTQSDESTEGNEGRSNYDCLNLNPTITIEPHRTDAIRELLRQGNTGRVMVQLGRGNAAGGVLNTCCLHFELGEVITVDGADDSGRARQTVTIQAIDPGYFSAGVLGRFVQFARA